MRRHGSYRRRSIGGIEPRPLVDESPSEPREESAPEPESFPLSHGEVEFAPVDEDAEGVNPLNPEPVSPPDASPHS